VGGAERITDIDISESGKFCVEGFLLRIRAPLAFFLGMEARVLKKNELTIGELGDRGLNVRTDAVVAFDNTSAHNFGDTLGNRSQAHLFHNLKGRE
jgi:hypothetical protein